MANWQCGLEQFSIQSCDVLITVAILREDCTHLEYVACDNFNKIKIKLRLQWTQITIHRNVTLTSVIVYYEVTVHFSLCHNLSYGKCVNHNQVANTDVTIKAGLTQYVLIFQKVAVFNGNGKN